MCSYFMYAHVYIMHAHVYIMYAHVYNMCTLMMHVHVHIYHAYACTSYTINFFQLAGYCVFSLFWCLIATVIIEFFDLLLWHTYYIGILLPLNVPTSQISPGNSLCLIQSCCSGQRRTDLFTLRLPGWGLTFCVDKNCTKTYRPDINKTN